jgi:hypothetical protein
MNIEDWLRAACADADKRGIPELKPVLQTLARSTMALRRADEEARAERRADVKS